MIRLLSFFFLCSTSVMASNEIPAIPTFSRVALQEIGEGKPSQALCLVLGDLRGSGALVSVGGHVGVLTAAHLGTPQSVYFMVPDKTVEHLKLDIRRFSVKTFFSMQKATRSNAVQDDLQILLVDGNPERLVTPLMLTSKIATNRPISGYGFGTLVADFFRGRLSVGIPGQYKLDERGRAERVSYLPAKVTFPNYEVNPIASWVDKIRLVVGLVHQKFNSQVSLTKITPTTRKRDGMILATSTYNTEMFQTHIGVGFSGGPVLQNDNIVGICQGGSLAAEETITPLFQKLAAFQVLGMWGLYLAGHKIPFLQKVATFVGDPLISPSISYILGRLGYTYLSTPLQLCIFNTAVFAAANIYLAGNKMYAKSQHALRGTHHALFVHMTPEIIQWIKLKLAESTRELATAS